MHYTALRSQNIVHHSQEQGKVNNSKMGAKLFKNMENFT